MTHPDPFFDPTPKFSRPDTTASSLAEWLRSDEVNQAIRQVQPPPVPRERGWHMDTR